jgi:hypothetical protein
MTPVKELPLAHETSYLPEYQEENKRRMGSVPLLVRDFDVTM